MLVEVLMSSWSNMEQQVNQDPPDDIWTEKLLAMMSSGGICQLEGNKTF